MLTKIPENAMNSFMAEIRRRKIDLREFRVSFFELSDFYSVLLRYKDTPLLELDSDKYPSYQVRLSLDTGELISVGKPCLLYTSPSPRDATLSRMPSSA